MLQNGLRSHKAIIVVVLVVVISVTFISLCLVWIILRTNHTKSLRNAQHTSRPSSIMHPPNNVENKPGRNIADFGGSDGCMNGRYPTKNFDLAASPFSPPRGVPVFSQPVPPPSVYVSGTGPLISPWASDSRRTKRNNSRYRGHRKALHVDIDALKTKLVDLEGEPEEFHLECSEKAGIYDSTALSDSPLTLLAPTLTSGLSSTTHTHSLAGTSITSSLMNHKMMVESNKFDMNLQTPSPPPTPTYTTLPINPSSRQSYKSMGTGDDKKGWSDVLSLAEYESGDRSSLASKSFNTKIHLPSPPPTPTLLFTPPSPPSPSQIAENMYEQRLTIGSATYALLEDSYQDDCVNFDQRKAFEDLFYQPISSSRGAAITFAHEQHKRAFHLPTANSPEFSNPKDESPPPYEGIGLDLETRLTLKRTTSLLSKPLPAPALFATRSILEKVATTVRPRPPPKYFEPLLLRKVDRPTLKTRTIFSGFMSNPVDSTSKMLSPIPREKMGFGTRGEIPPHVHVLEFLTGQVNAQ